MSPKKRYNRGKKVAKDRGMEWKISLEEYTAKVHRALCEYCGEIMDCTGMRLDRINVEDRYYASNNTNACCALCNMTRQARFTVEEMKLFIGPAIKKVKAHRAASSVEL